MAKDKNTYAKRQREALKRQKAETKQERRRKRKTLPHSGEIAETARNNDDGLSQ